MAGDIGCPTCFQKAEPIETKLTGDDDGETWKRTGGYSKISMKYLVTELGDSKEGLKTSRQEKA